MTCIIKKPLFFLSVFLFTNLNSFAQDTIPSDPKIFIKNGVEHKDDGVSNIIKVIGENSSGIYVLRHNFNKGYFLEKYDAGMNMIYSNKIETPRGEASGGSFGSNSFYLYESYLLKNKIYLFGSAFDGKKKQNIFYGGTYHESGQPDKLISPICTVDGALKSSDGYFNVALSRDSSKISIVKGEKLVLMAQKEKFSLIIIDQNLKTLSSKDLELPYRDYKSNFEKSLVDNEGNCHLLFKIWFEDKDKERGSPPIFYTVYSYYLKDDLLKQHEINFGEIFISGIDLILNDNNVLSGGGFYSIKKEWKMRGVYYFSVDPLTRILKMSAKQDFSPQFIAQFTTPSAALDKAVNELDFSYLLKNAKDLSHFEVRNMIARADGGVIMIAEYYRFDDESATYYSGTGTMVQSGGRSVSFNDIIVINILPDGKIAWMKKIGKKQSAKTGSFLISTYDRKTAPLGIASFQIGNTIHIVYNEASTNFKNNSEISNVKETMRNPALAVTVLITISSDGQLIKTPLFPAKEKTAIITPGFTKQTSNNTLLFYGEKAYTYRFLKIKFE